MKLKSMGLLNWANLPNRDYPFSGINMITGESGAGKTTLLDALQTILTGTTAGLFQYNPGQEEATQQSRIKEVRTLASYILGCDDASYARPHGAHGYLFANWEPEMGEKSAPFVSLIGVSAYLDVAGSRRTAKEAALVLAVIRGASLSIAELLEAADGEDAKVVPVEMLAAHFKRNYPQKRLEIARGKEDYLGMLYGGLRGMRSINRMEARSAARAISRFMVYKPLKNLDDFVRTEILEPHDITDAIRQVSGMMRSINGMEREAAGIEQGVALLNTAERGMTDFIGAAIDDQLARYEMADRRLGQLQRQDDTATRQRAERAETNQALERERNILSRNEQQTSDQLSLLEAQRMGVPVLKLKDDLERERDRLGETMNACVGSLIEMDRVRRNNRERVLKLAVTRSRGQDGSAALSPAEALIEPVQAFLATDDMDQLAIARLLNEGRFQELAEMQGHVAAVDNVHRQLKMQFDSLAEPLSRQYFHCQEQVERLAERIRRLNGQIACLENANQVAYPQSVRRALALITSHIPEAAPCVLCDHVELADPAWQLAVEGLVGHNRFMLLVDPGVEARVIDLMVANGLNRIAILQGQKAAADAGRLALPENSMVHLLRFNHHLAESYFKARYGNVRLLADDTDPATVTRGLKQNGLVCLNYRVFMTALSESELVFGAEARRRALAAQQAQLAELEALIEQERADFLLVQTLYDAARRFAPLDMSAALADVLETAAVRRENQRRLDALDLTECEALDERIREAREARDELSARKRQIDQEIGANANAIDELTRKIDGIAADVSERQRYMAACEGVLAVYGAQWPDFDCGDRIARIQANRAAPHPLIVVDGENFGVRMNQGANAAELALEAYNRMGLRGSRIRYDHFRELNMVRDAGTVNLSTCFSMACDLARQIRIALNYLRNDILARHKETLGEMTGRFNSAFVSHICHTLHNAVRQGRASLDAFNRKLRNHYFGEEYYQFEYDWVPEFQAYYRFFEEAALMSPEGESTLFGDSGLSPQSRGIFDEICTRLLDEDIDRSLRDLQRIADYRNYRTYDIKKCLPDRSISLKTYGAGSGGQMETPSYVIRSAGLASALHFGEGTSHLRTVMIDESFSKMDEARCKAVLDYLAGSLGLQVVFAVPTKSAGALHDHVDQVLQVTKFFQSPPRGELHTAVMVTPTLLKKEQVSELWQRQRAAIENRAYQMTFLDLVDA